MDQLSRIIFNKPFYKVIEEIKKVTFLKMATICRSGIRENSCAPKGLDFSKYNERRCFVHGFR